ncbi:MAG: M56 family metallopeptidase [Oscillospiraceae bacterium]|jgi:hypothetical protein
MSTNELIRGFTALMLAGALAFGIYRRDDGLFGDDDGKKKQYTPMIEPLLLPFFLIVLFIFSLVINDAKGTASLLLSVCFGIFLHISVYYIFLILLLPLLRRVMSAKSCALLWLLPNFLYITQQRYMSLPEPKWVWFIEGKGIYIALLIWALGFSAVIIWKLVSHILFRHRLLKAARAVEDPDCLELWKHEQKAVGIKKANYRLVISDKLSSPLSVGLIRPAIRVVLPDEEYSEEDLKLIFRHELIHIRRKDSRTKLFLAFCSAMCWFNPLMWAAMRRCAEDLELSCDELTLEYADEAQKRRYAELILRSAGDERGFTTCLSAKASSMRYRLKQIMQPGKRLAGGIIAGAIFFFLIVTSGYAALAYNGEDRLKDIFNGGSVSIESISAYDTSYHSFSCTDEAAFADYLSTRKLYKIAGNYDFHNDGNELTIILRDAGSLVGIIMTGRSITVTQFIKSGRQAYYLSEPTDWDYVMSLLKENEPDRSCPGLYFATDMEEDTYNLIMPQVHSITDEDGSYCPDWDQDGCCILVGFAPAHIRFYFSYEPEEFGVSVKPVYAGEGEMHELGSVYEIECIHFSAEYHIRGTFVTEQNKIYDAEFTIVVILPEDSQRWEAENY